MPSHHEIFRETTPQPDNGPIIMPTSCDNKECMTKNWLIMNKAITSNDEWWRLSNHTNFKQTEPAISRMQIDRVETFSTVYETSRRNCDFKLQDQTATMRNITLPYREDTVIPFLKCRSFSRRAGNTLSEYQIHYTRTRLVIWTMGSPIAVWAVWYKDFV